MKLNKKFISQLEKLLEKRVLVNKQSGRWLTNRLYCATEHLPDKEEFIFKVFKTCVTIWYLLNHKNLMIRKRILYMLGSQPKSKWTTFLDNLNTLNDQYTLATQLLVILVQELILKEKACQPFWTPVCKEISEKLLLPIGTDFAGLGMNSSNNWSQKQVVKSQSLMIQTTKQTQKNLQTTYSPLYTSSVVDKWENAVMPTSTFKSLKVKIYPTKEQKKQLDNFIDTSRFVYNRTLECIKNGEQANFQSLRDKLVTNNTKKGYDEYKRFDAIIKDLKSREKTKDIEEQIKQIQQQRRNEVKKLSYIKNEHINDFELETHKDIRANAVHECCTSFKSGLSNLRNGNIKFFNMKYKKKSSHRQTIEMNPNVISVKDCKIVISCLDEKEIVIDKRNRRKIKDLKIDHNVDLSRIRNEYFLYIPIKINKDTKVSSYPQQVCGIDLGVRTFGTVYDSTNTITEYNVKNQTILDINVKIDTLKARKLHTRKKAFLKREAWKKNFINKCHWDVCNDIVKNNDLILLGDIKSHDIVKGNKNHYLNRLMNDLKLYTFKQRLIYKAGIANKKVVKVHEGYTTKTCSNCGFINNNVGSNSVYECPCCHISTGRDMNAAKNMFIKCLII